VNEYVHSPRPGHQPHDTDGLACWPVGSPIAWDSPRSGGRMA
jgi:hypothetical protein